MCTVAYPKGLQLPHQKSVRKLNPGSVALCPLFFWRDEHNTPLAVWEWSGIPPHDVTEWLMLCGGATSSPLLGHVAMLGPANIVFVLVTSAVVWDTLAPSYLGCSAVSLLSQLQVQWFRHFLTVSETPAAWIVAHSGRYQNYLAILTKVNYLGPSK